MAAILKTDTKRLFLVSEGYTGTMDDMLHQYYDSKGYSGGMPEQTALARAAFPSTQLYPVDDGGE